MIPPTPNNLPIFLLGWRNAQLCLKFCAVIFLAPKAIAQMLRLTIRRALPFSRGDDKRGKWQATSDKRDNDNLLNFYSLIAATAIKRTVTRIANAPIRNETLVPLIRQLRSATTTDEARMMILISNIKIQHLPLKPPAIALHYQMVRCAILSFP